MKKGFFFLALVSLIACNSNKETKVQSMATKDSTIAETIKYPPTDYSVKFEMADPGVTAAMLELYTKGIDENSLKPAEKLFADTVMMYGGDGTSNCGSKDSVLARNRADWDKYTSMKVAIHSFVSLKSLDRDETWFLIWYKFYSTNKNGKKDSVETNENWRLNKEGKATHVYQYLQLNPARAKK